MTSKGYGRTNRGKSNAKKQHYGMVFPDLAPVDYFDKPEKPKKGITLPKLKFMDDLQKN